MSFDELDSLSRGSITKVNSVLTSTRDKYRKSYGRSSDGYPRACGFCGSTNSNQYLNDPTGARRFWPVRVLRTIDFERIAREHDQIWAEAFVRWRRKEPWHVNTQELRKLCEDEQEQRLEIDSWEEILLRWFNDPTKFSHTPIVVEKDSVFKGVRAFDGSKGVTTSDVLEHAVGKLKGQWTQGEAQRIGKILRRLGLERVQFRVGKLAREWRYVFSTT